MHVARMGKTKEYTQNFDGEASWKTSIWNKEKDEMIKLRWI
jgi:hypothetical protein